MWTLTVALWEQSQCYDEGLLSWLLDAIISAKAQRIYVTQFIQVSEMKCNHGQSDSKVLSGVPLTSLQLWLWTCCLSKKRVGHQKARANDRHGELCRNNCCQLLPASGHGESLQGSIGALSTFNKAPFKTTDFLCFWGTLKMWGPGCHWANVKCIW